MAGNGKESKRVSSITRKLHRMLIWEKIRVWLCADLLFYVLGLVCYALTSEYDRLGSLSRQASRSLFRDAEGGIVYRVVLDSAGKSPFLLPLAPAMRIMALVLGIVAGLQLLSLLFSFFQEGRRIQHILRPINEIALQADKLGRLSFSEDKYQLIEDAITRIQPQDQEMLQFSDKDLAGVEAAINNLLLRIRDANRQQARFVNDASHELRTPIAVIEGYANMLARWGKTDGKILDESISAIRTESAHMKHLVEQLLFLARGDAGRTQLTLEEVSLPDLARESYEEALMVDEAHSYHFQSEEGQAKQSVDVALLKQALRILLDNAAKYTPAGGDIDISFGRTEEGFPYIQVQDGGIGMKESDVAHMFERFYRSDEVRSYQGTGLGLSIAKWIADKHHAHYEITSREGLGTRIRMVFEA